MKKIDLIFACLLVLIFCFANPAKTVSQKEILKNPEMYPELEEYPESKEAVSLAKAALLKFREEMKEK